MAGIADIKQITHYVARSGVLPQAARQPWEAVGGGGTLLDRAVEIVGAAVVKGYRRQADRVTAPDRMEIQAEFQGLSSSPTWASGASGHVLWIDDGERALGVAIGDTIAIVNPVTGALLIELDVDAQPGGWTTRQSYHLIKDRTTWWELWVAGRLVIRLPYAAGATATEVVGTFGWGWQDATALAAGTGRWDRLETGIGVTLPPNWKVDRARSTMPAALQTEWTDRHEALLRATVGLAHGRQDAMARLWFAFTAAARPVQTAAFDGSATPSAGWTLAGDTAEVSVVRQRLRLGVPTGSDPAPTYAERVWTTPGNTDGVYYARATFVARSLVTDDARGRCGPYLQIRDGNRRIGAFLLCHRSNPSAYGWQLSDGATSGALGNLGDVLLRTDPFQEHTVELYVIGRERVLLFVDGEIAEDVPYSRFTATSSAHGVRIGRDGNADLSCVVDVREAYASFGYADNTARPLFQRRVAERLLFSAGCERNDVLDAWLRHREGVFTARGTDRVISEIRRLACDDDASLIVERQPSSWYLDVTYPEVSPVFVDGVGDIARTYAEFRVDHSPYLPPDRLEALIRRYLLPLGSTESPVTAHRSTLLTTVTSGATLFDVVSVQGFAVGDGVTLREYDTGTLIEVTYDADEGLTLLAAGDVRDWSGNDDHGALTGTDAEILNSDYPELDAIVTPVTGLEGVRSPSIGPSLAAGFTVAGRFTFTTAHGGTIWTCGTTANGVGVGGYTWGVDAAGQLTATIYSAAGSKVAATTTYVTPAAGTEVAYALRWVPGTNLLTLWVDGVQVAVSAATAFTMLDPGATVIGFGAPHTGTSNWWGGAHRDHRLYERALSDAEILALALDTDGRGPLATDADLRLSYVPAGRPALHAIATGTPIAADSMVVASQDGIVWAEWGATTQTDDDAGILGSLIFTGLDGDRLATITAGNSVTVTSTDPGADLWVEVVGIVQGSGVGRAEAVHVVGTTPVATTTQWAEVHGGTASEAVAATTTVTLTDTGTATPLYQLTAGERAQGVLLFDPPLTAGPSTASLVADAATTAKLVVVGAAYGTGDETERVNLNGTTPVGTAATWATIRAIGAGYLAAARTVTASAQLSLASGLVVVSTNGADTARVRAIVELVTGEVEILEAALNGTTDVALTPSAGVRNLLGAELLEDAAGTVRIRQVGPSGSTVRLAQFLTGARLAGIERRRVAHVGEVRVALGKAPATPRSVAVYGVDADGATVADLFRLSDTTEATGRLEYTETIGFAIGHCPSSTWQHWGGRAWRYPSSSEAARAVSLRKGWTIGGPGVPALDGILDTRAYADVTLDPVDLAGRWSTSENTQITEIDGDTVHTEAIAGSFGIGAIMRRR